MLKHRIITLFFFACLLVCLEVLTDIFYIGWIGGGLLCILASLFIQQNIFRHILMAIGGIIIIWTLFLTKSIWFLVIVVVSLAYLFKTEDGNELMFSGDRRLHPFITETDYQKVVIRPQSGQRSLMHRQKINDMFQDHQENSWVEDDINLVFLGGNTIIDLEEQLFASGEKIIMVRKLFGLTRIIVPRDFGLALNISAFSGAVIFERQRYQLSGENLKWVTPQYQEMPRKVKLLVSVAVGDVEVIIL